MVFFGLPHVSHCFSYLIPVIFYLKDIYLLIYRVARRKVQKIQTVIKWPENGQTVCRGQKKQNVVSGIAITCLHNRSELQEHRPN